MTILDADNRCFDLGRQFSTVSISKTLIVSGSEYRQDAMLTSIENESENKFVYNLAKEKNPNFDFIFLGGYGRSNNGNKWNWMDGAKFQN